MCVNIYCSSFISEDHFYQAHREGGEGKKIQVVKIKQFCADEHMADYIAQHESGKYGN